MALLPSSVRQTLGNYSFLQEFARHEAAYLAVACQVARDVTDAWKQANIPFSVNPQEDFADQHLVDKVTLWFLSSSFPYFLQALHRGIRQYIAPSAYWAWGEMMARYVLQEAINRSILL